MAIESLEITMADDARSRLGRGLAALIGDGETPSTDRSRAQKRVGVETLRANPRNPRRAFDDAEIDELAASMRERGIIQPIVVRPVRGAQEVYEIIAGERRWRAAQRAGLHDVPIVVLDVSESEALELAIIENVQRVDLNPIEEAAGYQALADQFKHSHEDIGRIVGKSRSHVANMLRLLKLSEPVQDDVRSGRLSAGHARALIGQPNADELARMIVERGLNVRQVEALLREQGGGKRQAKDGKAKDGKASRETRKDPDTLALEKRVSDALGLQVSIDHRGEAGVMHIQYRNLDQLDEVLRRLENGGR